MKKPKVKLFRMIAKRLPKVQYEAYYVGKRQVNHVKRMKRRFKTYGVKGVLEYCRPYIKEDRFEEFETKLRVDLG